MTHKSRPWSSKKKRDASQLLLTDILMTARNKTTNAGVYLSEMITFIWNNISASDVKTKYESNADTNAYTDAEKTKLAGIEAEATADQTGPEIKALYEVQPNTNAYTDAEKSKLLAIEANADVTDETNVIDALDGATIPSAVIEGTDQVLFQDGSDANNLKVASAQSIADLASSGANTTGSILFLATIAGWNPTYSGAKLTLLTYDDFEGITSNTKTLTYTGNNVTSIVHEFTYNSQTWTLTTTMTYSGNQVTDKAVSLTIV